MGRGLAYGTYIIAWPASSECFVPIDNNITSGGFRGGWPLIAEGCQAKERILVRGEKVDKEGGS